MNNLDIPEGFFCKNLINNAIPFDEKWYDWNIEKIKEFIYENSGNNFVYIEFSYKQLGKDDKWLQKQIKELGGDMLIVKRELLLQWTYASNISPFTEEQLSKVEEYVKNDNFEKIYLNNRVIYIIEPISNMFYKNWILSIDIGGGLGKDQSVFSLIDPKDMKTKMLFFSSNIGITDFADFVIEYVNKYVPNAIVVPERNNAGLAFIELILKSNIQDRLYYSIREDKTVEKIDKGASVFKKGRTSKKEIRVYGVNTTGNSRTGGGSRNDMMEILFMIMNERQELVNNKFLFDEIRTLYRNKSGKIEAQSGFHDDILMSYLIGLYVLIYGRNINKFVKNISDSKDDDTKELSKNFNNFKNLLKLNNDNTMETLMNDFEITNQVINKYNELKNMNERLGYSNKPNYNNDPKKKRILDIFSLNKKD